MFQYYHDTVLLRKKKTTITPSKYTTTVQHYLQQSFFNMPRSNKRKKTNTYRCDVCKEVFPSISNFKNHFQIDQNTECREKHKHMCGCCRERFHTSSHLNSHIFQNSDCLEYDRNKSILSGALQTNTNKVTRVSQTNVYHQDVGSDQEFPGYHPEDGLDQEFPALQTNNVKSDQTTFSTKNQCKKVTYTESISIHKNKTPFQVEINIYDETLQQRNYLLNNKKPLKNVQSLSADQSTSRNLNLSNRIVASLESSKPSTMLDFDNNDHNKIIDVSNTEHDKEIGVDYSTLDKQYTVLEDLNFNIDQGNVPSKESIRDSITKTIDAENIMSIIREEELNDLFEESSHSTEDSCSLSIYDEETDNKDSKREDNNTEMIDFQNLTTPNQESSSLSVFEEQTADIYNPQNNHPTSSTTSFIDGCAVQNNISKHCQKFNLEQHEVMCVDLYQMLRASNAPLGLYDKIISWVQDHNETLKTSKTKVLLRREKLINTMNQKVYHNPLFGQPRVSHIHLSSGRQTSIVTFSMKDIILKLVTDKSLFTKDNILLDIKEPRNPPPESQYYYSEVNTGSWHTDALFKETGKRPGDTLKASDPDKKLLMPWTFFIDGLKTDKLGKITVEAVLTSCLWLNRNTRNRSSAWDVLGFVEDQKLFRDSRSYVRDEKAQDYHDMMSHIFKEFKQIHDCGGMKVNLDFRHCGGENLGEYILIPVIQYIIGDCKGNDLLCGRMSGHSLKMKGACRDCFISPESLDYLPKDNENLVCTFIQKENLEGKDSAYLKSKSFLDVHNAFSHLSFGGCKRGIWGATPVEILHAVQLGLCEYLCESFEDFIFTNSAFKDIISKTASGIAIDSQRQSERDMPSLSPFRYGLVSISSLKATERFARVFSIFLTFANTYCIKALTTKKTRMNKREYYSRDKLQALFSTVEDLLIFHQWLKEDSFKKSEFVDDVDSTHSRAMSRILFFMRKFKSQLPRSGNCLKTIKFHQMLHMVDYIKRFGAPSNWDGSRGEHFGKTLVKDNAKLTNRRKETLNYDISRRVCEGSIIDRSCRLYFEGNRKWPSRYCNDTDLVYGESNSSNVDNHAVGANGNQDLQEITMRPRFFLKARKRIDRYDNISYDFKLDWVRKIPLQNYPESIQQRVCSRLFTGTGQIGRVIKLEDDQDYISIPGYTEITVNGIKYRCHPFYGTKGSWYDWAYFKFEGYEGNVPGRILMMFDLSKFDHMIVDLNTDLFDPDVHDVENISTFDHLTPEVWFVIQTAESSDAQDSLDNTIHFKSSLFTRVRILADDNLWLVPLSALVGPCFVVMNKDYISQTAEPNPIDRSPLRNEDSSIAYVVRPLSSWGKQFLPSNNEGSNGSQDDPNEMQPVIDVESNVRERSLQEESQNSVSKVQI